MCGIAGLISTSGRYGPRSRTRLVEAMVADASYRGPDHQAVKDLDREATFGYARLAIIDPDCRSHQPMSSSVSQISIVYNGELYNCRELRRDLQSHGVRFCTAGDTEVVLKAFEFWGVDAFLRFNGIFAVAIYDCKAQELVLACDRFGVKPLYFCDAGGDVAFCSDFHALAAGCELPVDLDSDAVGAFCALRYVPGNRTVLKDISKLLPGEVLRFRSGRKVVRSRYWRPSFRPMSFSLSDARDRVRDAVQTAVKRQSIGDAPCGILLSGGVDSAGILACMNGISSRAFTASYAEQIPSEVPANTDERFSVIHDHADESQFARLAADHCGATLTQIVLTFEDLESSFDAMVRAMGEPMASIDAIGHYCFASAIDTEIKFLLSGVGADEIFGGYVELYFGCGGRLLNRALTADDYLRIVGTPDRLDLGFIKLLRAPYGSLEYARACFAESLGAGMPASERLNETLQLFVTSADLPYWELKQADAMYMASAKEVRVPFLDNDVFELASTLSSSLKWADSREKYILREALRPLLPTAIIDRKKFPSLGTPSRFYNRPWFRERCRALADREGIWDACQMMRYVNGALGGPPDPDVLYRFIVLDQWLREYGIE